MVARTQTPGAQRAFWLRHEALRNGVLTGIYLSCVLVSWLEIANRVKELEPLAAARNFIAAALLVSLMAIPVLRFLREPARLFLAGLVAWTLLTLTYLIAELNFKLLESRMGFLHFFVLGTVSYGCLAVLDWVFLMCAEARQQHVAQTREAAVAAGRRRAQ